MQAAVRTCLTAGVALLGVGVIVVAPVAPPMPEIQIPSMTASASGLLHIAPTVNPANSWLQVFEHVFQNVTQTGTSVAGDPTPALRQLIATQFDYAQLVADGALGAGQALAQSATAVLSTELQKVAAALDEGNFAAAAAVITNSINGALLVPQALFEVLKFSGQITGRVVNLFYAVTDLNTWLPILDGAVGPIEAVFSAASDRTRAILTAIGSGDTEALANALIDIPTVLAGAFLNGYRNEDGVLHPGIFTVDVGNPGAGGLLQTLLITLPRTIATALGFTPTPVDLASTANVSAVPELNASTVAVKVARTRAVSSTKVQPDSGDSDAAVTTKRATTALSDDDGDTAVVKDGSKGGNHPKRDTVAKKPKDATRATDSSPRASKSSGSRSSAGSGED